MSRRRRPKLEVPAGRVTHPRLEWLNSEGRRDVLPLRSRTRIGRHPQNTLRLADREVSKEHCVIEKVRDAFMLFDLDSANGTFVGGRRVKQRVLLHGDELVLGKSRLTFLRDVPRKAPLMDLDKMKPDGDRRIIAAPWSDSPTDKFDVARLLADAPPDPGLKLERATAFHQKLARVTGPLTIARLVARTVCDLLGADNAVVLVKRRGGGLEPRAIARDDSAKGQFVLSKTVLKRLVDTLGPVRSADALADKLFSRSESVANHQIRSVLAVPLLVRGELTGALYCDSRARTGLFLDADALLLSGVAAHAALALEPYRKPG